MTKEEHYSNDAPENAVSLDCKLAGTRARENSLMKELIEKDELEEDVFQLEQMLDHFIWDGDGDALRRAYRTHLSYKERGENAQS